MAYRRGGGRAGGIGAGERRGVVFIKLAGAVVVVAAVGIGGVALLTRSAGGTAGGAAGTLEHHAVAKTSFDITTTSSGELEAKNQTELRNKLEGAQATIVEIVEEGKLVTTGDLLIKLNDEEIKNKINEAESQLESAKAEEISAKENYEIQISQNESALNAAQLKLDLARLDLSQWLEGEVKQKRQENGLALERADRELIRLDEKYRLSIKLEEQGFLSKDELKRDELAFLEAEAALKKAQLADKVYEEFQYPKDEKTKQSAVDEATAELERVKKKNTSELSSKEAALENRKRQTTLRDEQLTKLRTQLAACTITAPKDGLVVYGSTAEMSRNGWFRGEGPMAIGSQVWPNQLLMVLPDTAEMVATVKVHESIAGKVSEGVPATVKVEALGGRSFEGKVQSISVLAEQSGRWMDPNLREYTVKIALDDVDGSGLKPSMRCEAELRLGRVDDVLAMPVQAVFNEGMLRYSYVPAGGGKYVKRPIKMGRRSDRFVEILAGLEAAEQVLLRQPAAGEVLDRKWTEKELAAVGLRQTPEGKVESTEPGGGTEMAAAGGPSAGGEGAGRAGRPRRTGGPPGGPGRAGAGPSKTSVEKKDEKPVASAETTTETTTDSAKTGAESKPAADAPATPKSDSATTTTTPAPAPASGTSSGDGAAKKGE